MDILVPSRGNRLGEGFSRRDQIASQAIKPKHSATKGQSPAGWISDLVALRKVVILCSYCRVKFNPRRHGYRRVFVPDATGKTDGYTVNGDCDGCKAFTPNVGGGTAFQPEELYALTHIDPVAARRQSRAAARLYSVRTAINRS